MGRPIDLLADFGLVLPAMKLLLALLILLQLACLDSRQFLGVEAERYAAEFVKR